MAYDLALQAAARAGQLKALRLCKAWGATCYSQALAEVPLGHHAVRAQLQAWLDEAQ